MTCQNACTMMPNRKANGYRLGFRYCSTCTIFIKTAGTFCPCCNIRLRIRPINRDYRE